MLASVSKLVDKVFIVGFIIPVLLGTFAILALMRDVKPFDAIYKSAIGSSEFKDLTIAVLLLWVFAILLLLLNTLLFRLLEGYFAVIPRRRWTERKQAAYAKARERLGELHAQVDAAKPTSGKALDYYAKLQEFRRKWPSRKSLVLPTRFGNVIRAFETYPEAVYGIDAIPGWLRLQAVMSKEFEILLEDAHSQVSFFVNIWFLSLLFSVLAGGRFILRLAEAMLSQPATIVASWGYFAAFIVGLVVNWLAYESAVERAGSWGALVRSAFDVFLPDLAKKMGYTLPADDKKRRRFWQDLTSSFLYNLPVPGIWIAPDTQAQEGTAKSQKKDEMAESEEKPQKEQEAAEQEEETKETEASDTLDDAEETNGKSTAEPATQSTSKCKKTEVKPIILRSSLQLGVATRVQVVRATFRQSLRKYYEHGIIRP